MNVRLPTRTVPIPGFPAEALHRHRDETEPDGRVLVFADRDGGPQRRSNFRRRVWLPSLVRAGLLSRVAQLGERRWLAVWPDRAGSEQRAEFISEAAAVAQVVTLAYGGLRFHDLRHSYATWLITDGVPVNLVQRVIGHEQASTTLNRYTHTPDDYADRVRRSFADDLLTFPPQGPESASESEPESGAELGGNDPGEGDDPRRGETGVVYGARLRGGRAEPAQRSRGVQPPRVCPGHRIR